MPQAILGFCLICGGGTLYYWVKKIFARGKDTGYDLYTCGGCNKAGHAHPRKEA